jgi:hypothetical protein
VLAFQADVVSHLFRDLGAIELGLNLVLVLIRLLRGLNTLDDSSLIVNLGQQLPLLDIYGSILDPFGECEGKVCLLAVQDRVFEGRLRSLKFYRSLPPSLEKVLLRHMVAALERESYDFLASDAVLICEELIVLILPLSVIRELPNGGDSIS